MEEKKWIYCYLSHSVCYIYAVSWKCVCVRYLAPLVLGSLDPQYHLFCVGLHEITAIDSQLSDLNTWINNYYLRLLVNSHLNQ